jgi:hypothetical protein
MRHVKLLVYAGLSYCDLARKNEPGTNHDAGATFATFTMHNHHMILVCYNNLGEFE